MSTIRLSTPFSFTRKVHEIHMATDSDKYDVALSFAGENREYVKQVAEILRSSNVRVFYDAYEEVALWGA